MVSPIKPADWQNILKLLMLTMLADGRAYERQAEDIQTGETFEQDLLAIIDSLESIPDKKPLIRALKNMAKRDDEAGILSKSRERWA